MANIPKALQQHINDALFPNTPLIGSVDRDGYPRISLRGSTCVYDDETLAFWERSLAKLNESIDDGSKLTIFFQKPELRDSLLPIAGVARFFGTATVHRSGPICDRVWSIILEAAGRGKLVGGAGPRSGEIEGGRDLCGCRDRPCPRSSEQVPCQPPVPRFQPA